MGQRIALNTLFFIPSKVGGTEIFLRNQIRELSELDGENKYFIFANKENLSVYKDLPSNFTVINTGLSASNKVLRIFYEQLILPALLVYHKIDLLHSLGYTTPLITHCKKITSIFDLNYHFHPEDFGFLELMVYKILIPLGAIVSDKIIIFTNKSKTEMVKTLSVSQSKIEVVYPGVSEVFKNKVSKIENARFLRKFSLKPGYILSNAVSHPHKNLLSLVKSYNQILNKHKDFPNLVLLGFAGREQGEISKFINENGTLKEKVIFTGWVDVTTVNSFYRNASLFVFPSVYEGFGLPLIEAMATGVPVITSKYSCIPEVVGNGAMVIDTKNVNKLSDTILKVIKDKRIRNSLIKKGIKRSQNFTWKNFGQGIIKAYLS